MLGWSRSAVRSASICSSYLPSSLSASTRTARAPRSRGLTASASSALASASVKSWRAAEIAALAARAVKFSSGLELEGAGDGLVGLVVEGGVAGDAGLLDVRHGEVGPRDVVGRHPAQGVLQRGDAGLEVLPGVGDHARDRRGRRGARRRRRGRHADATRDTEDESDADDDQAPAHEDVLSVGAVAAARPRDGSSRGRAGGAVSPCGCVVQRRRCRRRGPGGPHR